MAPTTTTAAPSSSSRSRWGPAREWVGTVLRVVLAGTWLYAGVTKIVDPAESLRAVRAYRLLPEWLAKAVAYGLPYLEIAVGLLLLAGLATRLAALVSAALLVVFLAGMVSAAARGLRIECGCFGGGGDLSSTGNTRYTIEILRDIGLLVPAGFLAVWPRTRFAADDAVRGSVAVPTSGRVGPRRTKAAQERLAALVEQRRQQGERRVRVTSAVCGLALVVVALAGIGIQAARTGRPAGPAPQAVTVDTGVVVGKASAKVVVDLYEDMQCPACGQFERSAGPVLQRYLDRGLVKAQYHVVAFLDRASTTRYASRSANAAYCAADAGEFKRYHDVLYADQPAEGSAGLSDEQLIALGQQAGLSTPTFGQCVRDQKYRDFTSKITDRASRDGVVGTPTVLVDGTQLQGLTGDALEQALTRAIGS